MKFTAFKDHGLGLLHIYLESSCSAELPKDVMLVL